MTMDFKMRPWLMWVLIFVVAGVVGYFVWYFTINKNTAANTTTPSQTLPTPTPSVTTTDSVTNNNSNSPDSSTVTPTPNETSEIKPSFSAPDGWKLQTGAFMHYLPHNQSYSTQYTFYIKNEWHCNTNSLTYCMDQNGENGVLFTLGSTGDFSWGNSNDPNFSYQSLGPITTKDIKGNPLTVYIGTSPNDPNLIGSLDIKNSDLQIVKQSLEQK